MLTALRNSDLELLRYCHQLRFCTIDHLTALTGRHRQALNLRLRQLIAEKYIYRIKLPNPNHKHIYSIGSQGYRQLAYSGLIELSTAPGRLRNSELKPLFLAHAMLVVDIHTSLILGSQTCNVRLTNWREGKELYDSVSFYDGIRKVRLPVCPDALFTIARGSEAKASLSFALEADRSTTTRRTFDDKIVGYSHFLEQNRQIKSYGVPWLRVLTVTLTRARADSLADLARESIPPRLQKFFLFASRESFSDAPEKIYGPIYRDGRGRETIGLLP